MQVPTRVSRAWVVQTTSPAALGIAAVTLGVSLAYCVAAAPWSAGAPSLVRMLSGLSLSAERLATGRWHVLATHWLLHVDVWHLLATLTLLLGAGQAAERCWGTWRFVAVWATGGLLGAGAALALGATPMAGGTAGALAVAGLAVVLDGRARVWGPLGARAAWTVTMVAAVTVVVLLDLSRTTWSFGPQLAAAPVGLMAASATPCWVWWRTRRYLRGGMRRLAQEAPIRERVDALLERIGREGMGSLTRAEQRFLQRASAFFVAGREHDRPVAPSRPTRVDAPAPRPPAD